LSCIIKEQIVSSKSVSERWRIALSWSVAVVLGTVLLFTGSEWEKVPVLSTILFAAGCMLAGVASLGRLWCSLYISGHKNNTLVTVGPYSMCRNPLYFFSLVGAVGVGLATETLSVPLIAVVFFSLYYPVVIKSEEARLLRLHGEMFESYIRTTPSFFPRLSNLKEPEEYHVKPRIFRDNLFYALWFIWIIGILELIESLHEAGFLPVFFTIY
jgi:protein-S-isoprenylcysteine O-methyltransferase Ste14